MSTLFPASLVQIHYHDQPCGVRRVMELYSTTFKSIAGCTAKSMLLCSRSGEATDSEWECIDIPAAKYCSFSSLPDFTKATCYLTDKLHTLLTGSCLHFPVAVIGHNLNLGKNPALSAAFSHCASELGSNGERYRFFAVLHDFPEDGRIGLLEQLRTLEGAGVNMEDVLYSSGSPVYFNIPGTMAVPGVDWSTVAQIANPVTTDGTSSSPIDRQEIREKLRLLADAQGSSFTIDAPLYYYPSRMIYRKNLFEAFLLVSLVIKGTLVTGGPGTSAADAQRIALIKSMAANYHRSFIPEPFLVHQSTHRGNDDDKELYNNCYCGADAVITTSRAEGFGYSLIEPWFHGIAVVGRMPLGTSLLPGMSIPSLYHRLPVPAEWISIRDCYDLYSTSYHRAFAMKFASLQSFVAEYIIDNTIDFGILDERNQMAVIDRLCRNEQDLETFRSYLKKDTIGWPGLGALLSVDITSIRKNKLAVSLWGRSGFAVLFEKWLKTSQIVPSLRAWHRMLLRHFSLINNFRLNSIDR